MYRCRRLIAVVLSLAVVASAFIINIYADVEDYNGLILNINGTGYTISEGVGYSTNINAGQSFTLNLIRLAPLSYSIKANQSIALNFDLRVYVTYYSDNFNNRISNLNPLYSNNNQYYNSSHGYLNIVTHTDGDLWFEPDKFNKSNFGYHGSFILYDSSAIDLNLTSTWTNNSQANIRVYFIFENVDIHSSENYNLSNIIMPAMTGILTGVTLQNTRLFSDSFSYNEISYDSDGNSTITERSGNWITAMLGTLQSILAPVEKQVEEEQLAKDAGFNDVLDDAYENSSPGSIIDFLGIGSISSWDEEAYEGVQSDAITYWFSQSCKDNIDSVPVVRGEEPQIIDFYSSHISEYWEALGIDTANSSGN